MLYKRLVLLMRFKPLLSKVDLKAIQERSATAPDVVMLLWEVARLHSVLLYADQYSGRLDLSLVRKAKYSMRCATD